MPKYDENYKIAKVICSDLKRMVTCSNDIIPKKDLPFFYSEHIEHYYQKFGHRRIDLMIQFYDAAKQIRQAVLTLQKPKTIAALAVTKFGVGECEELSNHIFSALLKLNRSDIAAIVFGSGSIRYNHAIVLFGIQDYSISSIDELSALPDQVIIIDPLLNHVGRANTYSIDQANYLQYYQYNQVRSIVTGKDIPPVNFSMVEAQVNDVVKTIYNQGVRPFNRQQLELILREPRYEHTALLDLLNAHTKLSFWGTHDESLHLDAVSEITTPEDTEQALKTQATLKAGFFCRGKSSEFFVLPNINVPNNTNTGDSLPHRIHNAYFDLT